MKLGSIFLNPIDLFHGDLWCYTFAGGRALYFDDDHLSLDGARAAGSMVAPFINIHY
jgi:hypothetical protein